MSARRLLYCIAVPAALIAAAFLRAEMRLGESAEVCRSTPSVAVLHKPGRPCAVQLTDTGGTFELAFDAGRQYELIVSSLGTAAETYHVKLESCPGNGAQCCHLVPVVPLARKSVEWVVPTNRSERSSVSTGSHPAVPQRRFFLHVTAAPLEDPNGYVPIRGQLAAEGRHVRVYVDADLPTADLSPGLIAETIRLLDDEIIPRSRELIGEHADVDGDGKLAVLITPWLERLCGGRTSLNGCVRANDFQSGLESPFGNAADLLYLNPHVEPGPPLKALLAHEYTHAVCFSRRLVREGGAHPLEDDWLNEAVAHVAENLHDADWSNLDARVARYLASPHSAPLFVRDYYRSGLWRDPGCRGATFLFLRFCVDEFGEGLLRELVDSPLAGSRNLEQATGVSFPELFRHWTIALARDEIASVPLTSSLGDQQLCGVQRIVWNLDDSCNVDLCGTAASFIRLGRADPGPVRIAIRNPPCARLQVTIVRR